MNKDQKPWRLNILPDAGRIKKQFLTWAKNQNRIVTDQNGDLKKGDIIQFYNGYGVLIESEILGFDEQGKVYPLWDCYWFAIDIKDREVKLINS